MPQTTNEEVTLTIIKFSDLDFTDQGAASWLADEVGTVTPIIVAAAAHVGDSLRQ